MSAVLLAGDVAAVLATSRQYVHSIDDQLRPVRVGRNRTRLYDLAHVLVHAAERAAREAL